MHLCIGGLSRVKDVWLSVTVSHVKDFVTLVNFTSCLVIVIVVAIFFFNKLDPIYQ